MSTRTPPPSAGAPDPALAPLARQLRLFKWLAALLALTLAGGAGYVLYTRHLGQPVTILLAGKPVGTVRNAAAAEQVLRAAEQAKAGAAYAQETPIRLQTLQLLPAAPGVPLNTDDDVQRKLARQLKLRVHAWAIVVNGRPSLGLPSEKEAERTLALVEQHYAQMPPAAKIVGEAQIQEKVVIAPKVMDTAHARPDAAAAAPYFWTPTATKLYTVVRGDTGLGIAVKNHLPFADFLAANAGRDLNRLKPGDTVNVQRTPLLLSVEVKKTFTRVGPVLPHAAPSEAGRQRITSVVTYLNGQQVQEDVTNIALLEKPRTASEL